MADQLGYALTRLEYTSNVNQLLAESTVFNRIYCAYPRCVHSRDIFSPDNTQYQRLPHQF